MSEHSGDRALIEELRQEARASRRSAGMTNKTTEQSYFKMVSRLLSQAASRIADLNHSVQGLEQAGIDPNAYDYMEAFSPIDEDKPPLAGFELVQLTHAEHLHIGCYRKVMWRRPKDYEQPPASVIETQGMLIRYVNHVIDCEGIDFLDREGHDSPLSKRDRANIKELCMRK